MDSLNQTLPQFRLGDLKTIWDAAHWDKKLTKNKIAELSIPNIVALIKSPQSIFSLRISGCLILGIVKIYSKKIGLLYDQLNNISEEVFNKKTFELTDSINYLSSSSHKDLNAYTTNFDPYKSLKNLPVPVGRKKAKDLNVLLVDNDNFFVKEEVEVFGISDSFLRDIEIAEKWTKNDENLPIKRTREKPWQMLLKSSIENLAGSLETFKKLRSTKSIENLWNTENIQNTENTIKIQNIENTKNIQKIQNNDSTKKIIKNDIFEPKIRKKLKKTINETEESVIMAPETYANIDSTMDILKNINYYNGETTKFEIEKELIFFKPVIPDMASEISNFYVSSIKINKIKAGLVQPDSEPIILSNFCNVRPKNPIVKTEAIQEIEPITKEDPEIEYQKIVKKEETHSDWNPRTLKLLKILYNRFTKNTKSVINFNELSKTKERIVMACGFYEILQISLRGLIEIEQIEDVIYLKPTQNLFLFSF